MVKDKVAIHVEIERDQQEWLQQMAQQFDLQDISKALRVLLDFAMEEGDTDEIFDVSNARCLRCG